MSIRNKAAIVGIGETPTDRLGSKPGEPRKSSAEYVSWAMRLALEDAGLSLKDFNGQGLGVTIPTAYPQPFLPEEVAEQRKNRRPKNATDRVVSEEAEIGQTRRSREKRH